MIQFEKFTLSNGLTVIFHQDNTTPMAVVNVLYNVGARDENPEKTGFAHLFEHLMFGGSVNIPDFDKPVQQVGGESNAFTNNDYTNYYVTVPKDNLETAFWLESDRMLSLAFSEKSLEVQRNVVVEEFRQRYLNQPYGDIWLHLRPLAYKVHPYQWATIGKDISHIQNATIDDVKQFFYSFYAPNNAILVVSGNVNLDEVKKLCTKWFEPIEKRNVKVRNLPVEPEQNEERVMTLERDVPFDAIYKAYHICARHDKEYYATDMITDVLSNGKSSRFYQKLVKQKKLFSEVDAYISGDIDNGLIIITGKLIKGIDIKQAEEAIDEELTLLKNEPVPEYELNKIKNKLEANTVYAEMLALNKAIDLAYYELLGDASKINTEINHYLNVKAEEIMQLANQIFKKSNCSTIYYLSKPK